MSGNRLLFRLQGLGWFLIVLSSASAGLLGDDWPQFRGPNRDAMSCETGLWDSIQTAEPKLVWMAEGVGNGYAGLSVVGDKVFTTGNGKKSQFVSAVSTKTGKLIWQQSISDHIPKHGYEGSRSTPTVDGNRLYVVGSEGSIACLNLSDGKLLWLRDFEDWKGKMMSGWGFSESPLVDGEHVVCTPGGEAGMMVCLDRKTGRDVWAAQLTLDGTETAETGKGDKKELKDGAGYASIVVSRGGGVKQYVQLVGRGVIGVRASDGEVLWRYAGIGNSTANIPTVLAFGDNIFCSTGYNTGSALLKLVPAADGRVKMEEVYFLESKVLQNKHGGMVLVDGHIYCGHGNGLGMPICVDVATGKPAWGPQRGVGVGESSVTYAEGHVVFRFEDGTIAVIKATPQKYDVVRTFEPAFQEGKSWSYPVIADGKLYLREQQKIMCYALR
jgi:outer membrane protein assembly factor BamB